MSEDLEGLSKEELQDRLAEEGLPISGNKPDLIERLRAGKVEAAKDSADEGAPPSKRATKLDRFPELSDEDWVKGNPEQAKAMQEAKDATPK